MLGGLVPELQAEIASLKGNTETLSLIVDPLLGSSTRDSSYSGFREEG